MGLGSLPGLRVWCHRPSKGAFLPVEDPDGKGGNPGRSLSLFKASLAGPQQRASGWGPVPGFRPRFPATTPPFPPQVLSSTPENPKEGEACRLG